jgi:hypothetical protein
MPPRATAYWVRQPHSACGPVSKPVGRSHPKRPSPDAHVSGSPLDGEVLLRVPSRTIQPAHGLATRARLTGFRPSRDITERRPHNAVGVQPSASFRPQAFSASRRLAPPLGLAGLFHPAATSRVPITVQGFLSRRSWSPLIGEPMPPCRWRCRAHPGKPGLPRPHRLDFEAFIHAGPRCRSPGVSRRPTRSPHRVPLPPGTTLPPLGARFPARHPPTMFPPRSSVTR